MQTKIARSGRQTLPLSLGCALLALAVALPDLAQAQSCQHGAAIFKSCQSPKRSCGNDADCDDSNECTADSCDTITLDNHTDCLISLSHADTCGDITKITEAWDRQDIVGDNVRVPAVGSLPIASVSGNAICCAGPVLPCFVGSVGDTTTILAGETGCGNLTLPGLLSPGSVSFQQNTYVIQPNDSDPLEDQANVKVKDLCSAGVPGCSSVPSTVQFTAGTDLETGCINYPEPNSTPCTDTDANVCTVPGCDGAGACDQSHIFGSDSTPCPDIDNDACTTAGCDGAGICEQDHQVVSCNPPIDPQCDAGETCNPGTGQCETNYVPFSTPCTDTDANVCTVAGCNGAGTCDQAHVLPSGTACGDQADTDCTNPDTCDGAGNCLDNHEPNSTPCTDTDGKVCTTAGCNGAGSCDQSHVLVASSTTCPDTDGNDCTAAGCDNAGSCDQTHVLEPEGTSCDTIGTCDGEGNCLFPPPPDDHYKCYKTRQIGTPFARRNVTLEDQFGVTNATVRKPQVFCNPVNKNGEGINDPTAHLMCYKISEPRFQRRDVIVENQFGEQALTVVGPDTLCVPAGKDQVPSQLNINHFKCYKAREAKGEPRFTQRQVGLGDQFETKDTIVIRPRLLCNPVDKNGEGTIDPDGHLTCYRIKDAPGQPTFERKGVDVLDQFAEQGLNTLRGDCRALSYLCVPSTKRVPSPSGAFLDESSGVLD